MHKSADIVEAPKTARVPPERSRVWTECGWLCLCSGLLLASNRPIWRVDLCSVGRTSESRPPISTILGHGSHSSI